MGTFVLWPEQLTSCSIIDYSAGACNIGGVLNTSPQHTQHGVPPVPGLQGLSIGPQAALTASVNSIHQNVQSDEARHSSTDDSGSSQSRSTSCHQHQPGSIAEGLHFHGLTSGNSMTGTIVTNYQDSPFPFNTFLGHAMIGAVQVGPYRFHQSSVCDCSMMWRQHAAWPLAERALLVVLLLSLYSSQ